MCLYSKQILPRRAKKDIIVYKELIDDILLGIMTPYRRFKIKPEDFGKVLETKGYKCVQRMHSPICPRFAISLGYFHCYKTFPIWLVESIGDGYRAVSVQYHSLLSGRWSFRKPNQLLGGLHILVECTIPKGSQYWVGINDTICSDKLILNRILSATELYELARNNK